MVGNDLLLVHNDSMHYDLHWWMVGGHFVKCKKVTYIGNVGQTVDAVNIDGGDIVFSAKGSNPCSIQYAVELWVCGGDIVFSAKRSNPCSTQDTVDAVNLVVGTLSLVQKGQIHAVCRMQWTQ